MKEAQSKFSIHSNSHAIAKQKPKIRIIHIVAPEIIKTDVQNFRELVQRLTGKQHGGCSAKKAGKNVNVSSLAAPMKKEMEEGQGGGICLNPFLSFLGQVDNGFIHDVNEFPILPLRSNEINIFGDQRHQ